MRLLLFATNYMDPLKSVIEGGNKGHNKTWWEGDATLAHLHSILVHGDLESSVNQNLVLDQ